MKCGDEEWQHCRVEKMGCNGCYYNEIKKAIKMFEDLDMGNDKEFIKARENILNYINKLESKQKKIIDKIEEEIKNITSDSQYNYVGTEWQQSWVVEELQEILEIIKEKESNES